MQERVHSTNYFESFILVSPDSKAQAGRMPDKEGSVAFLQYWMIADAPYEYTSDDVMFEVYARRREIPPSELKASRDVFFSKGQPCFRASGLVKSHGWGVHSDDRGAVALFGVETDRYRALNADDRIKKIVGLRSKRA